MNIFLYRCLMVGLAILTGVLCSVSCKRGSSEVGRDEGRFRRIVIDDGGPRDPWGKGVGDINGDGLPDLLVGGQSPKTLSLYERVLRKLHLQKLEWPSNGELVWYANPNWRKHLVSDKFRFSTEIEITDIDGDGRVDIVSITNSELIWFRNPEWTPFIIDRRSLHDIELADFDEDGRVDIVARNQSGFNHNDGNYLHFYRQMSPSQWEHFTIDIPHGEGLKIGDMNGNGKMDVVVNGCWYENPRFLASETPWKERAYGGAWEWQDVFIDVADINNDGRLDIVLSPAEPEGKRYRISWFESPASENSDWREHIIDPDVETVHHFIAARDMNNDGSVDMVTAQMHQGEDPDEIAIYWNRSGTQSWEKEVIATTGSHSMRVADIDNDGDIDLFGANWSGDHQIIELWENQTCPNAKSMWKRHVIDAAKPWRSVFIMAADLDKDGYKDVVTGGWWYKNPNDLSGKWLRRTIGQPANNVAILRDLDNDGNWDILASQWRDDTEWRLRERIMRKLLPGRNPIPVRGGFVWAQNDGKGNFQIRDNVMAADGDFLQGAAAFESEKGDKVGLSWHESGHGIQLLSVPQDPVHDDWTWRRISEVSQDEALSVGDIDGDGGPDIMLGTKWLRNEGDGEWTLFTLHAGDENPDRNRLADMNRDGRLDVVVGYEAISVPGKIAWYEQGPDPTSTWTERIIGFAIGPMSLDVGDLDGDGDLDIVIGEHNLKDPESSRLLLFENVDGIGQEWRTHVIHTGDEHHNGAQLVDIDNDGDLDILSIGWGHGKVVLYENRRF